MHSPASVSVHFAAESAGIGPESEPQAARIVERKMIANAPSLRSICRMYSSAGKGPELAEVGCDSHHALAAVPHRLAPAGQAQVPEGISSRPTACCSPSHLTVVFALRRHACRRGPARRPLACRSYSPAPDRTSVRIRRVRTSLRCDCGTPLARLEYMRAPGDSH